MGPSRQQHVREQHRQSDNGGYGQQQQEEQSTGMNSNNSCKLLSLLRNVSTATCSSPESRSPQLSWAMADCMEGSSMWCTPNLSTAHGGHVLSTPQDIQFACVCAQVLVHNSGADVEFLENLTNQTTDSCRSRIVFENVRPSPAHAASRAPA